MYVVEFYDYRPNSSYHFIAAHWHFRRATFYDLLVLMVIGYYYIVQ